MEVFNQRHFPNIFDRVLLRLIRSNPDIQIVSFSSSFSVERLFGNLSKESFCLEIFLNLEINVERCLSLTDQRILFEKKSVAGWSLHDLKQNAYFYLIDAFASSSFFQIITAIMNCNCTLLNISDVQCTLSSLFNFFVLNHAIRTLHDHIEELIWQNDE